MFLGLLSLPDPHLEDHNIRWKILMITVRGREQKEGDRKGEIWRQAEDSKVGKERKKERVQKLLWR
jgi:hypothetical protein